MAFSCAAIAQGREGQKVHEERPARRGHRGRLAVIIREITARQDLLAFLALQGLRVIQAPKAHQVKILRSQVPKALKEIQESRLVRRDPLACQGLPESMKIPPKALLVKREGLALQALLARRVNGVLLAPMARRAIQDLLVKRRPFSSLLMGATLGSWPSSVVTCSLRT